MISGHELIKKYGLQNFELFNLIKSGLTAYSETGRRIVDIAGKVNQQQLINLRKNAKSWTERHPDIQTIYLVNTILPTS